MLRGLLLVGALALFASLPVIVSGLSVPAKALRSPGPPPRKDLGINTGKVIIDTDAGSDDAVAILLALGEQRRGAGAQVVAITCVHGNTKLDNVVVNVLKTLQTAGRLDIPVYRGASGSLITTPPGDFFFGQDGFGDFDYPNAPKPEQYIQKEHAVSAMVRLVSESPGEITLIALGSLTNVALAIRMYPSFLTKLKQLAILGGSVEGIGNVKPGVEFNFYMDPEANYIVFNSTDTSTGTIKPILLVPWESAKARHQISTQWRNEVLGKLNSPEMNLLNQAERYQLDDRATQWISSDPIVVALTLQPKLITTTVLHNVQAETEGVNGRGAIFVDYNDRINPKNTLIVTNFDLEGYKNLLLTDLK